MASHAWGAPRAPRGSNCAAARSPPPCLARGLYLSGFVICSAQGPEFVSKLQAPKSPTGFQNGTENESGISKKGGKRPKCFPNLYKQAKMGPKSPRRGRNSILVRNRTVSLTKGGVVLGHQNAQNIDKQMFAKSNGF